MGKSERLFADLSGLTREDSAQLAGDWLAPPQAGSTPAPGSISRPGPTSPEMREEMLMIFEPHGIMIEQVAMAMLLLLSFIGSIYHLIH